MYGSDEDLNLSDLGVRLSKSTDDLLYGVLRMIWFYSGSDIAQKDSEEEANNMKFLNDLSVPVT